MNYAGICRGMSPQTLESCHESHRAMPRITRGNAIVGARHGVPLRDSKGVHQVIFKILGIFEADREAHEVVGAFSPRTLLG